MRTVTIQITADVAEDQYEIDGALIEDYDPDCRTAWVVVDIDEIDCNYKLEGGLFPDEAWGQIKMVEEVSVTPIHCKWGVYDIHNDENICWEVEQWETN